jgi:hypothetical protein
MPWWLSWTGIRAPLLSASLPASYPYWETIGAQVLAGLLVVGSYVLAEHVKVGRRVRRGKQPAVRAAMPPPVIVQLERA